MNSTSELIYYVCNKNCSLTGYINGGTEIYKEV